MNTYHKIYNVFDRDPNTHKLIDGAWKCPEFEYLQDAIWIATEKIDGTNVRVCWDGTGVQFKGKTDNGQLHPKLVGHLNNIFSVDLLDTMFGETPACIYGEGFGEKIQNGGRYCKGQKFIAFDIRIGEYWLEPGHVRELLGDMKIPTVPVYASGTLNDLIENASCGFTSTVAHDTTLLAEGLVAVPKVPLYNRMGERIIVKLKTKDFA